MTRPLLEERKRARRGRAEQAFHVKAVISPDCFDKVWHEHLDVGREQIACVLRDSPSQHESRTDRGRNDGRDVCYAISDTTRISAKKETVWGILTERGAGWPLSAGRCLSGWATWWRPAETWACTPGRWCCSWSRTGPAPLHSCRLKWDIGVVWLLTLTYTHTLT